MLAHLKKYSKSMNLSLNWTVGWLDTNWTDMVGKMHKSSLKFLRHQLFWLGCQLLAIIAESALTPIISIFDLNHTGCFFNCSPPPCSVPKLKMPKSQLELLFHEILQQQETARQLSTVFIVSTAKEAQSLQQEVNNQGVPVCAYFSCSSSK